MDSQNYYDWREIYPELAILIDNTEIIRNEAKQLPEWTPWPENHYTVGSKGSWTVFPLVHTFPAYDDSKTKWVDTTTKFCPATVDLLKQIPRLRTALFSRLRPGTQLSPHTGWEDLANYVLRCHLGLIVPGNRACGMIVNNEVKFHEEDEILVFDDSKTHQAFNQSADTDRIILIIDMIRPSHVPRGTAKGGHTEELDSFVAKFS